MKSTAMTSRWSLILLAAMLASETCRGFHSPSIAKSPSSVVMGLARHHHYSRNLLMPMTEESEEEIVAGKQHKKEKKHNTKKKRREEYEQRKQQWLDRYGSLEALQATFGTGGSSNSTNSFFRGDLTPEQTRRLYHTLLPRTLLGLYELQLMKPDELAPLAYHARMAAKHYARSRCVWYARVATEAFDRYRSVRRNGVRRLLPTRGDNAKKKSNKSSGMSWDEIWSKYEAQIVQEECAAELQDDDNNDKKKKKPNEKDLTMRIYLRILEKSCVTNQAFDSMFLNNDTNEGDDDDDDVLAQMGQQLDQDVRTLLLGPKESAKAEEKLAKLEKKQQKAQLKVENQQEKLRLKQEKEVLKQEKEALKQQKKQEKKRLKELEKDHQSTMDTSTSGDDQTSLLDPDVNDSTSTTTTTSNAPTTMARWQVLRILAGTRQKFRSMRNDTLS